MISQAPPDLEQTKMIKNPAIFFILIVLIVSLIHLFLFSFRTTEDSPCWIGVGKYFLGQEKISRVSPHCLLNPMIPGLAAFLSRVFGITVLDAYLALNLIALTGSGILLYLISSHLTNHRVAMIAALIFLIDFHAQYYGFAAVPDAVTWFFALLLICFAQEIWVKRKTSLFVIALYGLLGGLAVLVKMNLVFLLPLLPLGLFMGNAARKYRLIIIYGLMALLLPLLFYSRVYLLIGIPPWWSLARSLPERIPTLPTHLTAFVSAFLYTIPFIIVGLTANPFKKNQGVFLLATTCCLTIPILLWPFVMSRFSFTLFPLLFPLAASGLWRIAGWMTPFQRQRQVMLGVLLIILFFMSLLRMHLTFTNQSHWEFFSKMFW